MSALKKLLVISSQLFIITIAMLVINPTVVSAKTATASANIATP
jgi:hypothetical protein